MVSVSTMVSVTRTTLRADEGKAESSAALVGQLTTVGAQEMKVRTAVVRTVRVVRLAAEAVAFGARLKVLFKGAADTDTAADDAAEAIELATPEAVAVETAEEIDAETETGTEAGTDSEARGTARITSGTTVEDSGAMLATELVPFWRR